MAYAARKAGSKVAPSKHNVCLSTRSKTGSFVFSDMCFLCSSSCKDSKDVRKVLSGSNFDDSIRKTVRKRGFDEWAVAVQGRIDAVADLFAADAVYRLRCYV